MNSGYFRKRSYWLIAVLVVLVVLLTTPLVSKFAYSQTSSSQASPTGDADLCERALGGDPDYREPPQPESDSGYIGRFTVNRTASSLLKQVLLPWILRVLHKVDRAADAQFAELFRLNTRLGTNTSFSLVRDAVRVRVEAAVTEVGRRAWGLELRHVVKGAKLGSPGPEWRVFIGLRELTPTSTEFVFRLTGRELGPQGLVPGPLSAKMIRAPNFLLPLLTNPKFTITSGLLPLATSPLWVPESDVRSLVHILSAPDRILPVVLVNLGAGGHDEFPQWLQNMAKRLAGSAVVMVLDRAAQVAFNASNPSKAFNSGYLRVFGPRANNRVSSTLMPIPSESDSPVAIARFRYQINQVVSLAVQTRLTAEGLGGVRPISSLGDIVSIRNHQQRQRLLDGLANRRPVTAIDSLPTGAVTVPTRIEILTTDTNTSTPVAESVGTVEVAQRNPDDTEARLAASQQEVRELRELLGLADAELAALRARLTAANLTNASLQEQVEEGATAARGRAAAREYELQAKIENLQNTFSRLGEELGATPKTVVDGIKWIERLFPDRFVFTERAMNMARKSNETGADCFDDLRALAIHLWPLIKQPGRVRDVPKEFDRQASGYEYAPSESHDTQVLPKVRAERRDVTPDGVEFFAWAHLKGPKKRRIYFAIIDGRIVISMIGHGHATTAGTRRM